MKWKKRKKKAFKALIRECLFRWCITFFHRNPSWIKPHVDRIFCEAVLCTSTLAYNRICSISLSMMILRKTDHPSILSVLPYHPLSLVWWSSFQSGLPVYASHIKTLMNMSNPDFTYHPVYMHIRPDRSVYREVHWMIDDSSCWKMCNSLLHISQSLSRMIFFLHSILAPYTQTMPLYCRFP